MRKPIMVRPLTAEEHTAIEQGLHSPLAFTLRRSQILLASARGQQAPAISQQLGCSDQTVREAGLSSRRLGRLDPQIETPPSTGHQADRGASSAHRPTGPSKPASVWQSDQRLDVGSARGGELGRGAGEPTCQ